MSTITSPLHQHSEHVATDTDETVPISVYLWVCLGHNSEPCKSEQTDQNVVLVKWEGLVNSSVKETIN